MAYTIREKFDIIDKKINEVGKDSVNYLFFADSHVDEYLRCDENGRRTLFEPMESVNKRLNNLISHLEEAVRFANENDNIDFIAFGGDGINANSIRGKQAIIDILNESFSPLKKCKKPIILAFGNHDDNGFQELNPDYSGPEKEWLISDKDWKEKVLSLYPFGEKRVHDELYEYSKYFYFDLEDKKTRIMVLDNLDMRKPFDENGMVTEIVNLLPRFWFTFQELHWICRQVFTAPDDWNYIVINHMGIENDTSDNCKNGENLRKIFAAYKNREIHTFTYTDLDGKEVKVDADFTQKTGKILLYNFGHQHSELVHYSEDIDLWQVATGTENAWGGEGGPADDKELPWVYMRDRQEGTERETCIDVFSVNPKICYKFNVGPGEDAEMTYK